jgi:hypothetical protein
LAWPDSISAARCFQGNTARPCRAPLLRELGPSVSDAARMDMAAFHALPQLKRAAALVQDLAIKSGS